MVKIIKFIGLVLFISLLASNCMSAPLTGDSQEIEQFTELKILTNDGEYEDYDRDIIMENINNWSADDDSNVWELSGLFEGDIMIDENSPGAITKNGLINKTLQWSFGIVPYHISASNFSEEEMAKIETAIDEFHERSCLKFRPYTESDKNYIIFESNNPGCYSSVGRQTETQIINLQKPNCLKHGTIVHEILHALGFLHQQSTFDRDDYVTINWENIKEGKQHNFKKYDTDVVTNYEVKYDYASVMHYSSKAFSKNGNQTIVPLKENVKIGQRKRMSKKDVLKLRLMYAGECIDREYSEDLLNLPVIIDN